MTTDFATFTRDCITALDERGHFPGVPLVGGDGPTPIWEETGAYFLGKWAFEEAYARQSMVLLPPDDDGPALVDVPWLPVLGWLLFAGFVALLVWAVVS